MCRLFGFRSNVPARVHDSLVNEKNSLMRQSIEHPDGWGIASYKDGVHAPEVARGIGAAHLDPDFQRTSSLVSAHTVVAHVRLASVGPIAMQNLHPFVYERWTFAHNGTVRDFDVHRATIESEIDPDLRILINGDTDSERCFYLFLTRLRVLKSATRDVDAITASRALAQTAEFVCRLTRHTDHPRPTSTNFLATDGRVMAATKRNRTLFYSECKAIGRDDPPPPGTRLNQIVLASEELGFEDHWHEVPENGVIAIESDLSIQYSTLRDLAA